MRQTKKVIGTLEGVGCSFTVREDLTTIVTDHPGHWEIVAVDREFFRKYPGLALHVYHGSFVERFEGVERILLTLSNRARRVRDGRC